MRCGTVAHKTYSLLRYEPTYWGLKASAIPVLLVLGAILTAVFGLYGVLGTAACAWILRVAFEWNDAALTVLRVSVQTLFFVDRHRRIRF